MKILVAGDTHGNAEHMLYLGQVALDKGAEKILVVGDFGYWEHQAGGPEFLDVCSEIATQNDLPIYWIDGNHENHTMLRAIYGPGGPRHELTLEGFWVIRPGLFYIPRGTRFVWNELECMGLGGAYSVDRDARLAQERRVRKRFLQAKAGNYALHPNDVELFDALEKWNHFAWWPEEEISEEELSFALSDKRPLDILFTHDKPRASNPRWDRRDLPDCWPNQDKVQEVVRTLKPRLLVHGHLHHRYQDQIRSSGESYTTVVSLANDVDPSYANNTHPPEESWALLELEK